MLHHACDEGQWCGSLPQHHSVPFSLPNTVLASTDATDATDAKERTCEAAKRSRIISSAVWKRVEGHPAWTAGYDCGAETTLELPINSAGLCFLAEGSKHRGHVIVAYNDDDRGQTQSVRVQVRAAYIDPADLCATQVGVIQRSDGTNGVLISTPKLSGFIPNEDLVLFKVTVWLPACGPSGWLRPASVLSFDKLEMDIPGFSLATQALEEKVLFGDVLVKNVFGRADVKSLRCKTGSFNAIFASINGRFHATESLSLETQKGNISADIQLEGDNATAIVSIGEGSVKARVGSHAQSRPGKFEVKTDPTKDAVKVIVRKLAVRTRLNSDAKRAYGHSHVQDLHTYFQGTCDAQTKDDVVTVTEALEKGPIGPDKDIGVPEDSAYIFLDEARQNIWNVVVSTVKGNVTLTRGDKIGSNVHPPTVVQDGTAPRLHPRNEHPQEKSPAYTESMISSSATFTSAVYRYSAKAAYIPHTPSPTRPSPLPFTFLELPTISEDTRKKYRTSRIWIQKMFNKIAGYIPYKKRVETIRDSEKPLPVGGIKYLTKQ
ncbi:hypothetical protein CONPUDRAFT_160841 [Coniophora puteana RWD-64-598 SS2]|uniref:Uncharacterized protein n=1 Tax=Coniophora puteana (strain RWD-64-598) TaxID=741705 RepID=A0A5M3N3E1_CONPW|nr:uncharacterized protein CONPUDRAFT_160841 [Coniophora puteana RWD-64-598 SS2]EIW85922.1 hypothetical protein CONPUDRAFT_160841 [Coniophora puteana RWD-64-598 SS2]